MINTKLIKKIRNFKNLSQKEIADALNVSEQSYRNFENGARNLHITKLDALAKIFNVNITDILLNQSLKLSESQIAKMKECIELTPDSFDRGEYGTHETYKNKYYIAGNMDIDFEILINHGICEFMSQRICDKTINYYRLTKKGIETMEDITMVKIVYSM